MSVKNWTPSERMLFGVLVIVGYIAVVWYGASGRATGANAETTIHDAMTMLGPLLGTVVYSVFKGETPPNAGTTTATTTPAVEPSPSPLAS